MTPSRWLGCIVVACAVAAIATLPFPVVVPRDWGGEPFATELRRLIAVTGEANTLVRDYRATQALERWHAATANADTDRVRVDAGVPDSLARVARVVGAEHWRRLGMGTSPAHAEVFVYFDTTLVARAAPGLASRRTLELRRPVDISYALPQATDGLRCVAIVRLRTTSAASVEALRGEPLLGPCGFYAAFGSPGAAMRTWLDRTGYSVARQSDWDVPRAPLTGGSALDQIGDAGGACLTGQPGGCLAALAISSPSVSSSGPLSSVLEAHSRGPGVRAGSPDVLGNFQGRLLADAVREIGPTRFAQIWRAPSPPKEAFAAAGVELDAWTRGWLARTYGPTTTRARIGRGDVLWLVLALPILIALAARPREQVLATRWLKGRA